MDSARRDPKHSRYHSVGTPVVRSVIPPDTPQWPCAIRVDLYDPGEIPMRYAPPAHRYPDTSAWQRFGYRFIWENEGYIVGEYTEKLSVYYKFVDPRPEAYMIQYLGRLDGPLDDVAALFPSYLMMEALA